MSAREAENPAHVPTIARRGGTPTGTGVRYGVRTAGNPEPLEESGRSRLLRLGGEPTAIEAIPGPSRDPGATTRKLRTHGLQSSKWLMERTERCTDDWPERSR